MDKAITVFSSLDDLKSAGLRESQLLPDYECLRAVSELTIAL